MVAFPSTFVTRLMHTRVVLRFVAAIFVAVGLAGCDNAGFVSQPRAGWRQFIVTVENQSPRPATLAVAANRSPMERPTGTAEPGVVPPGVTMDVTLDVPPGQGWAIFVNPTEPQMGPLVRAHDVPPDASGRMPITVHIDIHGNVSAEGPVPPGWFSG
jgi:hypothetical protein